MIKVALVTGASRGIGAATAIKLAQDGYLVCVNYYKNKNSADSVVEKIQASGGQAASLQADVSDDKQVKRLFQQIDDSFGRLDVLVNNAGILNQQMRLEHMSVDRINKILKTNITGPILCCQQAVKRMSTKYKGIGGVIVNVSSVASKIGGAGEYIDYAASKGAIDTLTIGLAQEVAAEEIRVNCVRPGFIYTDMHADGGEPNRVDRIKSKIPMGRGGQAQEVAEAIAWLVSEKSSYSTGTFIDVAGGK
jgi:NAD(P)-dependent dehydrogenase (short-subunit alcohol dehydrogenase family)